MIVKAVNHASVLIQEDDNFILTDPWYEQPAFGSWLPVPPTSIHPVYLLALAKDNPKFKILISHGHDDHLDDEWLSLFPKDVTIIIPEYKSKGFLSRLKKLGLTNINEASNDGLQSDIFKIKSYVNSDISMDDAILTIETPNNFVVHANDNWQELEGDSLKTLQTDANKFKSENILYMSQCNLADGFPNIYRNYTQSEIDEIHNRRVDNIIVNSLKNADRINAKHFLNYAGYTASFKNVWNEDLIEDYKRFRDRVSFKSNDYVKKLSFENSCKAEVLDMVPGDSFDFTKVNKQFIGINLSTKSLKQESYKYYEKYDRVLRCDSYKKQDVFSSAELEVDDFSIKDNFKKFVESRLDYTSFQEDIVGCKVVFSATDFSVSEEIVIGEKCDGRKAEFFMGYDLLINILNKKSNWENLYIGYGGEVETTPKDINIGSVVRWLAMYGYYYQRSGNV
jgi:hypothetical protein